MACHVMRSSPQLFFQYDGDVRWGHDGDRDVLGCKISAEWHDMCAGLAYRPRYCARVWGACSTGSAIPDPQLVATTQRRRVARGVSSGGAGVVLATVSTVTRRRRRASCVVCTSS